jgi:hydrogenase maturation protease
MSSRANRARAAQSRELLILGLGNVLLGDDGLGPAAVTRLQRRFDLPDGVEAADGGTLGLALLALIAESDRVILVDAIRHDAPAGSLVRIEGDNVAPAVRERLSPHQVGVADLLDAARLAGCYPVSVTLLGLVPEKIDLGVERSAAVESGMDALVEAIVLEASALGYKLVPKGNADLRGGDADRGGVHGLGL